jgi:hypothetical protein
MIETDSVIYRMIRTRRSIRTYAPREVVAAASVAGAPGPPPHA